MLYDNVPESTIIRLDRTQNYAIGLTLGVTKTTPIPALQYQSKILPIICQKKTTCTTTYSESLHQSRNAHPETLSPCIHFLAIQ